MKTLKHIILVLVVLLTYTASAQTGFNYKALIKDASGNIVSNQDIHIRFTIQTLTGPTFISSYQERHNATTDANGIVIVTIGEGDDDIVGDFPSTFWLPNITLNTEIDIERDGTYVDFGASSFKKVPMAISADRAEVAVTAQNVTGLEKISESINGVNGLPIYGWRLIGVNSDNYGNIGRDAVDLSVSIVNSSTRGATGLSSIAMGYETTASENLSTAMGYRTIASGNTSTALGFQTTALSFAETTIGGFNTEYTPNNKFSWHPNDRLFVIGNGVSSDNKSNALTVLKNGTITAPSFEISEITDNKALITKEYADTNYLIKSGNGDVSIDGKIQHTSTGNANLVPIAYGIIESNGNVLTGTGNFTAFLSGNVFIIDVNDTESLSYSNTVCLITPISTSPRTSSTIISDGNGDNDADLNVRIFNASGTQVTTTFQFVIYKL